MKIIAGLDVGTTGCKIALYNENTTLLATYYNEYKTMHKGGLHEIDFKEVLKGVIDLLKKAVKEYEITVLGVTSFGETFAMLDENDQILAPSMLYTDPRGESECDYLCDVFGSGRLTILTGAKPHSMYSISKILWHKNNNPELFEKCKKILLGQDFIVYSLTGNAQIDYSLAARTAAFDIEKKCWIKEIFDVCDIDTSLMSRPVKTGTVAGNIKSQLKQELGVDYDITVVNGCHDQVAAMIGSGVFECWQAMDGTGTVECIPVVLKEKPVDLKFYEYGYSVVPYNDDEYACYALSFTGGAVLTWFRDNFAEAEWEKALKNGHNIYAELDKRVDSAPTDILVLPHFAGAATPYMDNSSKAVFTGITLETKKLDIYKALMEGTSYEILLNFNTMKEYTEKITEIRATGGGANSDVWLQIKADILESRITALDCKEIGAAGTAAVAGYALGIYTDIKSTTIKMAPVRKVFVPDKEKSTVYREKYKKYANLYKVIKKL